MFIPFPLQIFYRPQTRFGKVMFSQVSVCPQGGVSAPLHAGIQTPRQAQTPWQTHPPPRAGTPPRQVHPLGRYTHGQIHPLDRYIPSVVTPPGRYPPPGQVHPLGRHTSPPPCPVHAAIHPLCSACWDTVNKRAVYIPLECILVSEM